MQGQEMHWIYSWFWRFFFLYKTFTYSYLRTNFKLASLLVLVKNFILCPLSRTYCTIFSLEPSLFAFYPWKYVFKMIEVPVWQLKCQGFHTFFSLSSVQHKYLRQSGRSLHYKLLVLNPNSEELNLVWSLQNTLANIASHTVKKLGCPRTKVLPTAHFTRQ